jgi:hypothetical protein
MNERSKKKIKQVGASLFKFAYKAVFIIPSRKDNVAIKALKVAALAHAAYESYKDSEPEPDPEPKQERALVKIKNPDNPYEK